MWILDTVYREGVDIWSCNGGIVRDHAEYDPPFLLHLEDPHAHHGMLDALADQFRAEPCRIPTLFGELDGFSVYAGRPVAEAIEQQTGFAARLFNVDIRRDQQYLAGRGIVPCSNPGESRFTPDFSYDLRIAEIRVHDDPARSPLCTELEFVTDRSECLQGTGATVAADLFSLVRSHDPDIILMSHADAWMPKLAEFAKKSGDPLPFSRSGKYRRMNPRSYWSYGRVEHKEAALIPDGRVLIDTSQSFVYHEGGLDGVFMASRISGLPPNMASRLTPGTLISSYETYEAVRRGIAVPFRKSDAEDLRKMADLRGADRGGMMFQPEPGIFTHVDEIDFTSMYPSIIVRFNLSPETIGHTECEGFLPAVLDPLVQLRRETKKKRSQNARYAGIDSMLKWMLVTCFGYTGYKNAKFGRIEVHEAITDKAREILIQAKDLAESMGFVVLHGIVDCLWVQGPRADVLNERIAVQSGIPAEIEHFDWIVFLPQSDGLGAYNRYYGRLSDGSIKVRGIAARRHDTPEYIRHMQQDMLEVLRAAATIPELEGTMDQVSRIYRTARDGLSGADPRTLAIGRRISRTRYAHRCLEGAAVEAYRDAGVEIAPGMKISYVVQDAGRYRVCPAWAAESADTVYYRALLEKAWTEIAYALTRNERTGKRGWEAQRELADREISGAVARGGCGMPGHDDDPDLCGTGIII